MLFPAWEIIRRIADEKFISRHPMQEADLRRTLERWLPGQVEEALRRLEASGEAQVVERYGERFWSAAACRYPS